jgi:hypothetical protein
MSLSQTLKQILRDFHSTYDAAQKVSLRSGERLDTIHHRLSSWLKRDPETWVKITETLNSLGYQIKVEKMQDLKGNYIMQLTFGKYKGDDIKDVPTEYLQWGSSKLDSPKWKKEFSDELNRRKNEEKAQELKILADPDSEEIFNKLVSEAEIEIEREISASGCEHEYDRFNISQEAENRAKAKIAAIKAKKELENKELEILKFLGCDKKMLDRIEYAWSMDELNKGNFAKEEKYNAAIEYCKKKSDLLEVIYEG